MSDSINEILSKLEVPKELNNSVKEYILTGRSEILKYLSKELSDLPRDTVEWLRIIYDTEDLSNLEALEIFLDNTEDELLKNLMNKKNRMD